MTGISAPLLPTTALIRFVRNGSYGTAASITYRAWDQTSGAVASEVDASTSSGGTTPFGAATDTAVAQLPLVDSIAFCGRFACLCCPVPRFRRKRE